MATSALTAGQTAALVAVRFDEVATGAGRYVNESGGQARWSDGDVAALVDAGLVREGRGHVRLTREGRRWTGGRR